MIDPAFPWHVGRSWQASQYHFADRDAADAMAAHLSTIERGWAVRHENEIIAAKRAATEENAR